jgi:hypothetical protein
MLAEGSVIRAAGKCWCSMSAIFEKCSHTENCRGGIREVESRIGSRIQPQTCDRTAASDSTPMRSPHSVLASTKEDTTPKPMELPPGMTRRIATAILILMVLAVALLALRELSYELYTVRRLSYCVNDGMRILQGNPGFQECTRSLAKLFIERDYLESKDLAKAFLTLISAILVGSITFSEKIVDIHNARTLSIGLMISCWFLLLSGLITCGTGLAFMALGAGMATYRPDLDYWHREDTAVLLFLAAGVAFVLALAALVVAGIVSLVQKRAAARTITRNLPP